MESDCFASKAHIVEWVLKSSEICFLHLIQLIRIANRCPYCEPVAHWHSLPRVPALLLPCRPAVAQAVNYKNAGRGCSFQKKTRFLHVSQAKDLHGHFELTFLFQLHHLEPLMTLFGRFNKVEARCETSGPKMLRKHVSLDLHLVKLMAFYITSWQAIASTPREQKNLQKPSLSEVCCMGPHLINQASNLPINSKKVAKKVAKKTTTTQQRLQDPAQTTLMT